LAETAAYEYPGFAKATPGQAEYRSLPVAEYEYESPKMICGYLCSSMDK
jgi:hypothetical protein